MTVNARGKSPYQSLILLCLSASILVSGITRQATAKIPPAGITTSQSESLSPVAEPSLPPLGEPSQYLPSEETDSKTRIDNTYLVIKLSQRRVFVYRDEQIRVSYPIAVGKTGWQTPIGRYNVLDMQRYPAWEHPWNGKVIPPGPDNPLGVRWIAFWTDGRNLIGFHGTPNEELVGQAVSHGCVRMRNQDILALYAMVKIGTLVSVEP